MANVTITWTNGRKITHVQGRASMPRKHSGAKANWQSKRVCILNEAEAEKLELHGQSFPCNNAERPHTHYSREAVERLVAQDEARWVGNGQNVAMFTVGKTWQPMLSGGMNVMQMVPGGALY